MLVVVTVMLDGGKADRSIATWPKVKAMARSSEVLVTPLAVAVVMLDGGEAGRSITAWPKVKAVMRSMEAIGDPLSSRCNDAQ